MRVGLLITSIGNFGEKGYYNSQEIGLAKELEKYFDELIIYKAVSSNNKVSKEPIENCLHSTLVTIPVKQIGINGIWNCRVMDNTLDALIYFCDTQISVPRVYKWCKNHNINLYPYIGVVESHSNNFIKKLFIDILFYRNIRIYKKCTCFAKTTTVVEKLNNKNVKSTVLVPVGLDLFLVKKDYENYDINYLKNEFGFSTNDKILLFVGRLNSEKQPLRMIDILYKLIKVDQKYKLYMIGTGELKKEIEDKIIKLNLSKYVKIMDRIPNEEMWKYYRVSDAFINLNQQEIFGMAILEAMYYDCNVIAWKAPGPNMIIENGISGWLVDNDEEIFNLLQNTSSDISKNAHKRIINDFTWEKSAKIIIEIMCIKKNLEENFKN